MSEVVLYHNPRCSKSRAALALLEENGVEPRVIRYLDTPLTETELRSLAKKLELGPSHFVRKGEDEYKSMGLSKDSTDEELFAAMAQHPKLMERPIIERGSKAVIGRPPENLLALL